MILKDFSLNPKKTYAAPGELIVVLHDDANRNVVKNIPQGPMRRVAVQLPNSFGVQAIDGALEKFKCHSICKVHAPMPLASKTASAEKTALVQELSATYRLRFDEKSFDAEKTMAALSKLKEVKSVSLNHLRFTQAIPNDPMFAGQWGLDRINCPDAWDRTTGSASVTVAIVDSGVDLNHPDLVANLVPGRDFVDIMGTGLNAGDVITLDGTQFRIEGDVLTVDNNPQDEVGHGTHVAGTVGAVSNNMSGVAGVAWGCRLMPVRVLFRIVRLSDGRAIGVGTDADIAAGITWAVDNGARIINLSLGGPNPNPLQQNAVNYAVSNNVLVVAAMGNDNSGSPSYPAAYADVLSVGATNQFDNRAWFSNFGAHIDVVAPGVNIDSTVWDDAYTSMDGTSMATPHVAGLAALIMSCNSSLTAAQVADIIRQTARPLRDNPTDPVPNNNYGYGIIDARAALDRACRFKSPFLDTTPSRDIIRTLPAIDEIVTTPSRDLIQTRPSLDILQTLPSVDQIQTQPFLDEIGTSPIRDEIQTRPSIDWVKRPALDKIPALDRLDWLIPEIPDGPFVLTTPHHYKGGETKGRLEQLEAIFQKAKEAQAKGELTDADYQQLDKLFTEYQSLKQQ